MAEVPVALYTGLHQRGGYGLRARARDAKHRYVRVVCGAESGQFGHVLHHHAALQLPADLVRAFVECGHQVIAPGLGGKIAGYGAAQTACTDEHCVEILFTEQQLGYLAEQHIHMVADALLAETAEAVEILPDL